MRIGIGIELDQWGRRAPAVVLAGVCGGLCLVTTGCLENLQKHSLALAAATAPVVDQAAKAYQEANAVHDAREDYDATLAFDNTTVVYNPRKVQPLLSEKAIDVRLTVLKAFQEYVKKLVTITAGTDSKELDKAAASLGGGLTSVANDLIPGASTMETTIVVENGAATTTTASASANAISATEGNAISVAVDALGQFLISHKVKKELPGEIVRMDPYVQKLCGLLESDVDALKEREKIDFDFMINQQTQFILQDKGVDVGMRRQLIMQLPQIARKDKAANAQLDQLKAAVVKLGLTHHALAADAQGNNPESLKMKLGELAAAGESLGKFYSSLPGS